MRDEDYWYGPGWKRLRNAVWLVLRQCQEKHPGTMDQHWLEKHLLPALACRQTLFWQLATRLFFDLDTLAHKLADCEDAAHQCRALKDYLWEQKLIVHGQASPDRIKTWRRILLQLRAHFPVDTDWDDTRQQQALLERLPKDKHFPSTLKTLQVYLHEFLEPQAAQASLEAMNSDELAQLARHTSSYSSGVEAKFAYCMDELQRQAPHWFAALEAAGNGTVAPTTHSPGTQTRYKQKGIQAIQACLEAFLTV